MDEREGKIAFSSNLKDRLIVLEYISDGLAYEEAYPIPGEEIDGIFKFPPHDVLVEARWRIEKAGPDDINHFQAKIDTKLDGTTIGLFISMLGFTPKAIARAENALSGRKMILADGKDVALLFAQTVDLEDGIQAKIDVSAKTGRAFFPLDEM